MTIIGKIKYSLTINIFKKNKHYATVIILPKQQDILKLFTFLYLFKKKKKNENLARQRPFIK